jgi:hypothetical protein
MPQDRPSAETYSPWTIVNMVFQYLVDQGLHPTLGEGGDPAHPAEELLRALGIVPSSEGDSRLSQDVHRQLADLRAAMLEEP